MEQWFTHYDDYRFLFLNDLLLAPVFILIATYIAKQYVLRKKNPAYKKYFVQGLLVHYASAIAMALVYQYYYDGGGDSHTYFTYVQRLREIAHQNFDDFIKIAVSNPSDPFTVINYMGAGSDFYFNPSSGMVVRMALYLSYPLLNTYLLISFVFTTFCFYGCWKIFMLFRDFYPHLEKEFALSCLFLPSVCFWGTGILKDPICMGALGALTYHIYKLVFERSKILRRILMILICFYLLRIIKVYIVLAFLPAYSFWIFFRYKTIIRSNILKSLFSPFIFVFSILIGMFVLVKVAQFSERYTFENLIRTAKDTQNWIYLTSQRGGSGYSLGNIDYTPIGILKVFPKAVNVALFRPYLWEARKPILIPAALEGLFSLFFTIRLLYKAGFIRFTKLILTNPEVQFCMVFSIMFAFSVGFTSYNFGSLVRYKIPLMPFYFIALFILADKEKIPEVKGSKKKVLPKKPLPAKLVPA